MSAAVANGAVCAPPDFMEQIYNNRRRNRYPELACRREYNAAAGVGCNLKPSFVAQPFLRYLEPPSYAAYLRDVNDTDRSASAEASGETSSCCGKGRLPPPPDCTPCAITLSCGNGWFGESCRPGEAFRRREYPVGVTHIPASSLPVLTQYEWENPGGLYHYDSPEQLYRAYDGTYNGHLAQFAKFAFQNERERLRLQYGIYPPFPEQPPSSIPPNVAPRFQLPRPAAADAAPPIPYNRQYLALSDDCGCNKSYCATECLQRGTTCSAAVGQTQPMPIQQLYAQQRTWPCINNTATDADCPPRCAGSTSRFGCGRKFAPDTTCESV